MNALIDGWTPSAREELLFILYSILAVMCFAYGHTVFGWMASVKAGSCLIAAIYLATKEARDIK